MDYSTAQVAGALSDTTEESFFVTRPTNASQEQFIQTVTSLGKKYEQDAIVLGVNGEIKLHFKDDTEMSIGQRISLNKIEQAYSQLKKKPNVPFVFEGVKVPVNNLSKPIFEWLGIKWI